MISRDRNSPGAVVAVADVREEDVLVRVVQRGATGISDPLLVAVPKRELVIDRDRHTLRAVARTVVAAEDALWQAYRREPALDDEGVPVDRAAWEEWRDDVWTQADALVRDRVRALAHLIQVPLDVRSDVYVRVAQWLQAGDVG